MTGGLDISQQTAPKRPTTPWVDSDSLDQHLDLIGAEPETRRFCHALATEGAAVIDLGDDARRLIDQALVDIEPYFRNPAVARVQDAWLRSKAVRRLATFPKLMDVLDSAYGRRAFAFQTLSFNRGTQQPLHSDAVHFYSEPAGFMCGVWIAMEDIRPDAGPLNYVAGSHRLPFLSMQAAGVDRAAPTSKDYESHYVPALAQRLAESGLALKTSLPRKGEAVVWAANLAHGGSAIRNPESTRRSLVVHVYFEDCLYYTPMTSDSDHGRYQTRLPMNVRTGGWVWPRRDGRRAGVPRGAFVDAVIRRTLRRPNLEYLSPTPQHGQP